jgi:hypothetical protein
VGLFRRDKGSEDRTAATDGDADVATPTTGSEVTGGAPATTTRDRGPWDVSEVADRGRRVDLGVLWLPGRDGMELRMEVEKTTRLVSAAAVSLHGSALQLQVFAAPRTEGIWDEIRAEIAESVTKQGGTADDVPGPFGRELLARIPVRTQEGRTGHRPARFVGHDGPRWFLRGVLTGRAAVDPEQAEELEAVFADVVVLRGSEARAPRELLPLTMPGARPVEPAPEAALEPPRRGPEITEIH